MANIYLSPSLQEFNEYLSGGSEEYYMNLIADAMEPYLLANNIDFTRNRPEQTLTEVINESNSGTYDLHLALHSNAAPENLKGELSGPDIYYFEDSEDGRRFAEILEEKLEEIYPDPELVDIIPTRTLRELRRTSAPSALVEIAYHDNAEDEQWIKNNIDPIAKAITEALAEFFEMDFVDSDDMISVNSYKIVDDFII
ncbi:MAG: N-acetylmuramoyl-L-alanine amidase [Lachnospiraceae bacterium]|nr:N-acetylmuramoyl-L-alanine amidase [Lachnospiraceae bacterium]